MTQDSFKPETNPVQMHQAMRWFGPHDTVSLSDIRQAGCAGVVTALHQIPVGAIWTPDEIERRKRLVERAGMTWTVIESLPVSEDIKKRNVAAAGLGVVTYNFMPVLDWLRTDVSYELPDGSRALYFDRLLFVAFDLFLLRRPEARLEYDEATIRKAEQRFMSLTETQKKDLFRNLLLGLPGSDDAFTPAQVLEALDAYKGIDAARLRKNLLAFIAEVAPVAESCGLRLAIHPDDPPYPVLGLPRVMSTEADAAALLEAVPSAANGLCFCTGSFGARAENDILKMLKRFGERVHFLHLRNTKRDAEGAFFEAAHLAGDTDMVAVINEVLDIQERRGISLPMRPDHGHQMLDDLKKSTYPGYSAIGRLKGLAELRGVEHALLAMRKGK